MDISNFFFEILFHLIKLIIIEIQMTAGLIGRENSSQYCKRLFFTPTTYAVYRYNFTTMGVQGYTLIH